MIKPKTQKDVAHAQRVLHLFGFYGLKLTSPNQSISLIL